MEARLLDALSENSAAQALRWRCFDEVLSADIPREYLKQLPDFEDVEAEERLHICARKSRARDCTAILSRLASSGSGRQTYRNAPTQLGWCPLAHSSKLAEHLQQDYPRAATILYRTHLDNILGRAHSKNNSHGAKYLTKLTILATDAEPPPNSRRSSITRHTVIVPKNQRVENWTSPAFDALGERHEEIKNYGKPDPGSFEAG
ncbi:DUF6880 family protein [Labrenzia sp. THAF82]|uniref:DUF6880 family protein n=1 Tax=Labrenzia sp. THAF82 TaxID=2587861 RepID=UPI00352B8985